MDKQINRQLFQLLYQHEFKKLADYIKKLPKQDGRFQALDLTNKAGQTPLHWCLKEADIQEIMPTLMMFIHLGADVYLRNREGETALALIDQISDAAVRRILKNAIIKSYDERLQQTSFEDEGGKAM